MYTRDTYENFMGDSDEDTSYSYIPSSTSMTSSRDTFINSTTTTSTMTTTTTTTSNPSNNQEQAQMESYIDLEQAESSQHQLITPPASNTNSAVLKGKKRPSPDESLTEQPPAKKTKLSIEQQEERLALLLSRSIATLTPDEKDELKILQRMKKNREAAHKSRNKIKHGKQDLDQRAVTLVGVVQQLKVDVISLETENRALKDEVQFLQGLVAKMNLNPPINSATVNPLSNQFVQGASFTSAPLVGTVFNNNPNLNNPNSRANQASINHQNRPEEDSHIPVRTLRQSQ